MLSSLAGCCEETPKALKSLSFAEMTLCGTDLRSFEVGRSSTFGSHTLGARFLGSLDFSSNLLLVSVSAFGERRWSSLSRPGFSQ